MICTHETLFPSPISAFPVGGRSGMFTVLLRIECGDCGKAFRFMGAMRPPPEDPEHGALGPWANWSANEMGVMIEPLPDEAMVGDVGRA